MAWGGQTHPRLLLLAVSCVADGADQRGEPRQRCLPAGELLDL